MPVHQIKITKKMTCGGCTGTVEAALRGVDGVTDVVVSLEDQTATITTDSDEKACQCTKAADGKCKCGSNVSEVEFTLACGLAPWLTHSPLRFASLVQLHVARTYGCG